MGHLGQWRSTFTLLVMVCIMALSITVNANTKLTILFNNRPVYVDWLEAVLEDFKEQHPTIDVDIVIGLEKLPVLIAGGTPPDISHGDPHTVIDLARQGLVEDLLPYIDRNPDHFSDWLPPTFEMAAMNGRLYGLPMDLQLYTVYYNVDAFDTSGLQPPGDDWTYDDFGQNARKLTLMDAQGNVSRYGSSLSTWRNWTIPIWAFGGDFVDSWTSPTKFVGHSDETRRGMEFLQELVDAQAVTSVGSLSGNNAFMTQGIAMYMQNSIAMRTIKDIDEFTWDVAAMPAGSAGRVTVMNALNWFVLNNSPEKDKAWTLLQHITSEDAYRMLINMVGVIPPSTKLIVDEWIPSMDAPLNRINFLTEVETARADLGALTASVYGPIGQEALAAITGEKPITSALENMEQLVNAAIGDLK